MGNTSEQKAVEDDQRGQEPSGCTALMYACQQGDLHQVNTLLRYNAPLARDRDRTQKIALHYCAETRTAQCADVVHRAAPDLVNAADEDGLTPLHLAVIAGNIPFTNFLLANNANVKALDNEKHSVVHWATVCGETAALRAVLLSGAPVSTPDVHGGFPLHYAAQMCGAREAPSTDGRANSAGKDTNKLGLEVLDTLLTFPGIRINVEDGDGRQPLLWAASAGSAAAVLALVAAGSAPEAADKDGLTALHCAASRGHTDCLEALLMMCGVAPDVIDTNGCTALHYAVTLGHADATALLLAHGAKVNRQDRKGRTPAHCGCAKGQVETVRMLGAHGADLWIRSARGDLPLHEAASSGRRQLVRWLLAQRPSQVNATNNDGRTPLHVAALNDNTDLCKILLDHGANVNSVLRTSKNVLMTPLDCALRNGFRSTAKFLQLNGGLPFTRLRAPSTATPGANVQKDSLIPRTEALPVHSDSDSEHEKKMKPAKRRVFKHRRKVKISEGEPQLNVVTSKQLKKELDSSSSYTSPISIPAPPRGIKTKSKESQTDERFIIVPIIHQTDPLSTHLTSIGTENGEIKMSIVDLRSLTDSYLSDNSNDRVKITEVLVHANQEGDGLPAGKLVDASAGEDVDIIESTKVIDVEGELTAQTEPADDQVEPNAAENEINVTDPPTEETGEVLEETQIQVEEGNGVENDSAEISPKSIEENKEVVPKEIAVEVAAENGVEVIEVSPEQVQNEVNDGEDKKSEAEPIVEESIKHTTEVTHVEAETDVQKEVVDGENTVLEVTEDAIEQLVEDEVATVDPLENVEVESELQRPAVVEESDKTADEELPGEQEVSEGVIDAVVEENKDEPMEGIDGGVDEVGVTEEVDPKVIAGDGTEGGAENVINESVIDGNINEDVPNGNDDDVSSEKSYMSFQVLPNSAENKDRPQKDVKRNLKGAVEKVIDGPVGKAVKRQFAKPGEKTTERKVVRRAGMKPKADAKGSDLTPRMKNVVRAAAGESKDTDGKGRREKATKSFSKDKSTSESISDQQDAVVETPIAKIDSNNGKIIVEKKITDKSKAQSTFAKDRRKDQPMSQSDDEIVTRRSPTSKIGEEDEMLQRGVTLKQASSDIEHSENGLLEEELQERPKLQKKHKHYESIKDNYSDDSFSDQEEYKKSEAKKRRNKSRSKSAGKESYGSDSQMLDSGFEPSPRSSRIPRRNCSTKPEVNMTSVTQSVQTSIRRYHLERKIFQQLLELKRLQIRTGQANEALLVKRAIDDYHKSTLTTVGAGRYSGSDLTFKSFEKFLYEGLRKLQKGRMPYLNNLPETPPPLYCTHPTMQCDHATHAYTGIPCAAYITKLNHHTIPKIGFGVRPGGFLPRLRPEKNTKVLSKGSVTLELTHGREKQLVTLPAERLDQNKKYYVTFTVKGQADPEHDIQDARAHRHAKSC